MKRDLYAEVSTRIVAELEAGAAPWVKPWSATAGMNTPCNAVTNRPYSGCNVLLLWMAQTAGYRTPRFLFLNALEATLEVLPPSKSFAKVDFSGDLKLASDDFDALEKLRRLAFAEVVDEPKQLKLWAEEAA